ncbi:unnamed protein product, partial [Iphiclides podalirius]
MAFAPLPVRAKFVFPPLGAPRALPLSRKIVGETIPFFSLTVSAVIQVLNLSATKRESRSKTGHKTPPFLQFLKKEPTSYGFPRAFRVRALLAHLFGGRSPSARIVRAGGEGACARPTRRPVGRELPAPAYLARQPGLPPRPPHDSNATGHRACGHRSGALETAPRRRATVGPLRSRRARRRGANRVHARAAMAAGNYVRGALLSRAGETIFARYAADSVA